MKNFPLISMVTLSLVLGGAFTAVAQEDSPEKKSYEQRRKEAREALQRKKAQHRAEKLLAVKSETRRLECRVESVLDRTLMVSAPYQPEVEPVLKRFGFREVFEPPEHLDRVLYQNRVFQVFSLRDEVPDWKVEDAIGRTVELELEQFVTSGVSRVVRIREPTSIERSR